VCYILFGRENADIKPDFGTIRVMFFDISHAFLENGFTWLKISEKRMAVSNCACVAFNLTPSFRGILQLLEVSWNVT
jgi:hypothetical protein